MKSDKILNSTFGKILPQCKAELNRVTNYISSKVANIREMNRKIVRRLMLKSWSKFLYHDVLSRGYQIS